jgi:hypothetical protein
MFLNFSQVHRGYQLALVSCFLGASVSGCAKKQTSADGKATRSGCTSDYESCVGSANHICNDQTLNPYFLRCLGDAQLKKEACRRTANADYNHCCGDTSENKEDDSITKECPIEGSKMPSDQKLNSNCKKTLELKKNSCYDDLDKDSKECEDTIEKCLKERVKQCEEEKSKCVAGAVAPKNGPADKEKH